MFDSPVYKRVQAIDRAAGATAPAIDRAAPVVETQPVNAPLAIDSSPQIGQTQSAGHRQADRPVSGTLDDRLAAIRLRLRASETHLRQSSVLLSELQETVVATMRAIRTSQHCIAISDRVIARAQTLDCAQTQTADGD